MKRALSWGLSILFLLSSSVVFADFALGPKAKRLPNSTLRVLPNGIDKNAKLQLVPVAQLLGKPIAILYWKVGDKKSEAELKVFQALNKLPLYKGKVHFLAAVKASTEAAVKEAVKRARELKITIPVVMDRSQLAPYLEAWFAFPRYGLVDKDGFVRIWNCAQLTEAVGPNMNFLKALGLAVAGKPVPTMRGTTKLVNTHTLVGKKIPNVGLNGADGKPTTARKYHKKGRPLLIAFWSVTCAHCRVVMPVVAKYWQARKGNLDFISITRAPSKSLKDMIRDFQKEQHVTWPVSYAPENATLGYYNIVKVPTLLLVDQKGIIRYTWIQPDADWIAGALEVALMKLF